MINRKILRCDVFDALKLLKATNFRFFVEVLVYLEINVFAKNLFQIRTAIDLFSLTPIFQNHLKRGIFGQRVSASWNIDSTFTIFLRAACVDRFDCSRCGWTTVFFRLPNRNRAALLPFFFPMCDTSVSRLSPKPAIFDLINAKFNFSAHIHNIIYVYGRKFIYSKRCLFLTFTCHLSGPNAHILNLNFLSPKYRKIVVERDWNSKISQISTKIVFFLKKICVFWKSLIFFQNK